MLFSYLEFSKEPLRVSCRSCSYLAAAGGGGVAFLLDSALGLATRHSCAPPGLLLPFIPDAGRK